MRAAFGTPPRAGLAKTAIPRLLSAGTTPAKLRLVLAGLLVPCVLWCGVGLWSVRQRTSAAADMVTVSEALSIDAQQIYRSLSDADATASTAFLSGGLQPLAARRRYEADIAMAATRLESAAAARGNATVRTRLATLAASLPVYSGEVETARADNRLGLPLGAAYLREASTFMRSTMLPAANDIYATENAHMAAVSGQATGLPLPAIAVAALACAVLLWSQWWLARRTHRVFNQGLVIASAAAVVSQVWLITAIVVARGDLLAAQDHGSAPVEALARADIAALRARGDESLTLVTRSSTDTFHYDFLAMRSRLGPGPGTLLTAAATAAAGSPGARFAAAALRDAPAWYAAHERVNSLNSSGEYSQAVHLSIGSGANDSASLFARLDADLSGGISKDEAAFTSSARAGRSVLSGLEAATAIAATAIAAASVRGLTWRLAEYR